MISRESIFHFDCLVENIHPCLTQGAERPFDFQKNSPPLGHAFFDVKQHGEQRLLKAFFRVR